MTVIRMKRDTHEVAQFNHVTSISYDESTKQYTVIHSGGTSTFSNDNYFISILAN